MDFSVPQPHINDAVLIVGGKKFHVNKAVSNLNKWRATHSLELLISLFLSLLAEV